tara:strand:- start:1591 stop:1914 length:324 start_codon:yes stop_codon:yes gene_type:complete
MAFNLPSDEFGRPAQLPPNKVRVSPEAPFNVTASPSVQKTIVQGEFIEIQSDTKDVFFKWGTTACTTANADGRVKAGGYRHYVAPNGAAAINFITAADTASVILIRN